MTTVSPVQRTISARLRTSRDQRLVAHIDASELVGAITATIRDGEFNAVLVGPGLGSPSTFVGTRTDDRAYDAVLLSYGAGVERTWIKLVDHGSEVVYALASDSSTTGYVTRPPR